MTHPLYLSSIPVFKQMLGGLRGVLAKAEAHAQARSYDPSVLLQARLFPDMFPTLKQVQVACDFAKNGVARTLALSPPTFDDTEQTFADLYTRIDRTVAFLDGVTPAQFEGSDTREVVIMPGTPRERRLPGAVYIRQYAMAHFFFHVTTAYNILRHNGVEVGKRDYMGQY